MEKATWAIIGMRKVLLYRLLGRLALVSSCLGQNKSSSQVAQAVVSSNSSSKLRLRKLTVVVLVIAIVASHGKNGQTGCGGLLKVSLSTTATALHHFIQLGSKADVSIPPRCACVVGLITAVKGLDRLGSVAMHPQHTWVGAKQ